MRSHLATKRLSAYLDEELPDRELRQVEAHVSECPACQTRLHGLRLVVSNLQRMPAVEPPPSSARSVELEAALRFSPPSRWTHRPFGQRGIELLRNLIQLSAMTAGALAIIAVLAAWNASRERATSASTSAPPVAERSLSNRAVVNGKAWVYRDGWWQEEPPAADDVVVPAAPGYSPAAGE